MTGVFTSAIEAWEVSAEVGSVKNGRPDLMGLVGRYPA